MASDVQSSTTVDWIGAILERIRTMECPACGARLASCAVRGITAERVARATLHGYLRQKREVIVPWTMHVPVKLYQLFPNVLEWAMAKMAE